MFKSVISTIAIVLVSATASFASPFAEADEPIGNDINDPRTGEIANFIDLQVQIHGWQIMRYEETRAKLQDDVDYATYDRGEDIFDARAEVVNRTAWGQQDLADEAQERLDTALATPDLTQAYVALNAWIDVKGGRINYSMGWGARQVENALDIKQGHIDRLTEEANMMSSDAYNAAIAWVEILQSELDNLYALDGYAYINTQLD